MALDSKVHTNVPKTIKKWWKQRLRWNIGGLQTLAKYFNLSFKKNFGSLSMFLLPVFSVSYIVAILGLFLIFYIFFNSARWLIASFFMGFNPIGPIYLIPDLFWLLSLFALGLSLLYLRINFRTMNKVSRPHRKILDLLFYLLVYVTIFPFNLLHSSINFLTKKYEW